MISFPFDNKSAEIQDRAIDSDTFSEYLKRMIGTNGIFSDLSSKMLVTAGEEMTVIVKPGDGFIEGKIFIEDKDRTLSIQASESADRIDTVVVRSNKAERSTDLYVVKGTAGTSPKQPELTREGDIYELGIANIYIPKVTTSISQDRITDTRLNSERCGVAPTLGKIDTTELYLQYQTSLDKFLDTVAQAIDGTLAGNLQNQINDLQLKRTLLFQGGVSTGNIQLIDNVTNYRFLIIGFNLASQSIANSSKAIFPVLYEKNGYQDFISAREVVPEDQRTIVTYTGTLQYIDETTLNIYRKIINLYHMGNSSHSGRNEFEIKEIWGIR